MSALDLITKFGKNVTLSRENGVGAIGSDGKITPSAATTSTIKMSIQPLSGQEVLRLPDGLRNKTVMKGYSYSVLQAGDEINGIVPDKIIDGSITYEVNDLQFYESSNLSLTPHYRSTLVRVNP
jgi:hypothetical protein